MRKIYILFAALAILNTADAQYSVSTYAGTGAAGLINGTLTTAQFTNSFGICRDNSGTIYIADNGNNCIRKITTAGIVSTYAGSATAGYIDGNATTALFNNPTGVCADDSGNVYVADFLNQRIRKINTSGIVSTIAGSGVSGYNDGIGIAAQFNYPRGICIDHNYNIYVGDSWNHRIRKITLNGNVTTYAGGGMSIGVGSIGAYIDAADTTARFYTPCGVAVNDSGNVFVADAYNHRIREINTSRVVTTVIGSGATGVGMGGYGNGPALSALLNVPTELFVDSAGNIYIGDTFNNRVRKMNNMSGMVINMAGNGTAGFVNGIDTLAEFNFPRGIIADNNGIVYVVDYNNNRVRMIAPFNAGTNDLYHNNSINFYPNPASSTIAIHQSTPSTNQQLLITNILGEEIYHQPINNSTQITIDISQWSNGVYFYQIRNDKETLQGKFVVEK